MGRGTDIRCLILCLGLVLPAVAPAASPRIAALDWTIAGTLIALDAPPRAVAQAEAYRAWVREPALPEDVIDAGLRAQPNLELLAALAPDRIVIPSMRAHLAPRLRRIAPVETVTLFTPGEDMWAQMRRLTRTLAALAERPARGEALIRATEARIEALAERLDGHRTPVLVVQFMDARHVRVFGEGGVFDATLQRLGLPNAWERTTNRWGFSLAPLEALAGIEARIVVVKPFPEGVLRELEGNGLWRRVTGPAGPVTLEPVWSFGGLPAARRFAEHLVPRLEPSDGD